MNNNWTPFIATFIISAIGITLTTLCCHSTTSVCNTITKPNTTRNYEYEHYCDSIYDVDPDYYHDVLVETDSFQNYIEQHGQWWEKQQHFNH